MKSIAFYNNKGGVGKTTTVTNISYLLATNSSVLIIDLDGQANCSRFFADEPKPGLERALVEFAVSPDIALCSTRYPNIDIITATPALNGVLPTFSKLSDTTQKEIAEKIVSYTEKPWYNKKYDYVIIDLPPALNILTERILSATDYVFVPIELGTFAIQGIPTVTDIISRCGTKFGGCFANKFDKDNPADVALMEMLKSSLGCKAMNSFIPFSRVVKNSISFRLTAPEYMGWTYAAECCSQLTAEIIERISEK